MKKISWIKLNVLFSFFISLSIQLFAQKIPSKKEVLKTAEVANAYFMNKWPDPGKEIYVPSKNKTWPSNIWTRAVYYEGLMALYRIDKMKIYYDYAVDWAVKHNWNLRGGITTRNGDN